MREDEIYLLTKGWVIGQKFQILGGQPPNGTDRFPVIEIKSEKSLARGSRTSFKPDLVVATSDLLIIVECKPKFDEADIAKLNEISASHTRLRALITEIRQRRCLERRAHSLAEILDEELIKRTRFCVSYSGKHHPVDDVYSLVFNDSGTESILYLGQKVVESIIM